MGTRYEPMTLVALGRRLAVADDEQVRWKLLWEFLEEYRWVNSRVLKRAWFPAELAIHRADALVWAPAAFRKHGVYLSVHDLATA